MTRRRCSVMLDSELVKGARLYAAKLSDDSSFLSLSDVLELALQQFLVNKAD